MCLILHVPADIAVSDDQIITAWENNKDGMGIMSYENGKITSFRSLVETKEEVLRIWKRFHKKNAALHFRTRTSGEVSKDMSHPFRVLNKKKDGIDLFMMHNGVLNGMDDYNKAGSDTWHFVTDMLRPFVSTYGIEILDDPFFLDMLEEYVGRGNKLLFLDGNGKWTFINRKAGSETIVPGCWASNTYSLAKPWKYEPSYAGNNGTSYYGKTNGAGGGVTGIRNRNLANAAEIWDFDETGVNDDLVSPVQQALPMGKVIPLLPKTTDAKEEEIRDMGVQGSLEQEYDGPFSQFFGGYPLWEIEEKDEADMFKFVVTNPEDAADILMDMVTELKEIAEDDYYDDEVDDGDIDEEEEDATDAEITRFNREVLQKMDVL